MPVQHKYVDNIQRYFEVTFKIITFFDAAYDAEHAILTKIMHHKASETITVV